MLFLGAGGRSYNQEDMSGPEDDIISSGPIGSRVVLGSEIPPGPLSIAVPVCAASSMASASLQHTSNTGNYGMLKQI